MLNLQDVRPVRLIDVQRLQFPFTLHPSTIESDSSICGRLQDHGLRLGWNVVSGTLSI